jgi:hypothetical protein
MVYDTYFVQRATDRGSNTNRWKASLEAQDVINSYITCKAAVSDLI